MEKLKVGDRVVKIVSNRWTAFRQYKFGTIERLTKTQAITDKGDKIINEPRKNWHGENIVYSEYGDKYTTWQISTDKIVNDAISEQKRITVSNWFQKKRFTEEEQTKIYELLEGE